MKTKIIFLSLLAIATIALSFPSGVLALDNDDHNARDRFEKSVKEIRDIGSTIEVNFNNDGKVMVRGAKVTSVSGTNLNVAVSWGLYAQNFIVVTDSNTKFVRKHGGASAVSEVSVGDFVSFHGKIDTTQTQATVKATIVKDWSNKEVAKKLLEKRTFEGTLKSVAGTTAPTTLVLTVKGVDYTVNVPTGISILNKNWLITSLANFRVGDTIRVYGATRADNTTTIDATIVRDASI